VDLSLSKVSCLILYFVTGFNRDDAQLNVESTTDTETSLTFLSVPHSSVDIDASLPHL